MTKNILLFLLIFSCLFSFGQNNDDLFFLFDKDWKATTDLKSFIYFSRSRKLNDTCWQLNTYAQSKPMLSSEEYRDAEHKVLHGSYIAYWPSGFMDSTGYYLHGKQNGDWYFLNDEGTYITKKVYSHGKLLETHDLIKEREEKKDSTEEKKRDEKESAFKGGLKAWQKYLTNNFKYPEAAVKAQVQGMVHVIFIVNIDGSVSDVAISKSVEYSLDEESMRLINKSPKWVPANQDGKIVKSFKKQPVGFRLQ